MTACGAPTIAGGSCPTTNGLCAECGLCLSHCEHRREQVAAARLKGNQSNKRQERLRVVQAKDVPGGKAPESLGDVIAWASWCAFAAATGLLDGITVREINRSLGTLKVGLEKRDYERRIRELDKDRKALQEELEHYRRGGHST
jgi:hypothetical protein